MDKTTDIYLEARARKLNFTRIAEETTANKLLYVVIAFIGSPI